jgi:hypothetical protein
VSKTLSVSVGVILKKNEMNVEHGIAEQATTQLVVFSKTSNETSKK